MEVSRRSQISTTHTGGAHGPDLGPGRDSRSGPSGHRWAPVNSQGVARGHLWGPGPIYVLTTLLVLSSPGADEKWDTGAGGPCDRKRGWAPEASAAPACPRDQRVSLCLPPMCTQLVVTRSLARTAAPGMLSPPGGLFLRGWSVGLLHSGGPAV